MSFFPDSMRVRPKIEFSVDHDAFVIHNPWAFVVAGAVVAVAILLGVPLAVILQRWVIQ